MKHTPGPWKVEVTDEGICYIRIPQGHDLCFGDLETTDACCFANAALIAAAPDLFDALEGLLNCTEHPTDLASMDEAYAYAHTVIAKAKGE